MLLHGTGRCSRPLGLETSPQPAPLPSSQCSVQKRSKRFSHFRFLGVLFVFFFLIA